MSRRGLASVVPVLVIVLAVALRWSPGTSDYIDRLTNLSFDFYQRVAPRPYAPVPVRIVGVDDRSLAEFGQWPWPRTLIAALVDRLTAAGAATIAFDIVFAEPDRTSPRNLVSLLQKAGGSVDLSPAQIDELPDNDEILGAAIAKANVVLGYILTDAGTTAPTNAPKAGFAASGENPYRFVGSFDGAVVNLPLLRQAAQGDGFLNHEPEWDRVVRRVPVLARIGSAAQPSLAAEALRVATGTRSYIVKGAGASGENNFGQNTGMVALRIGGSTVPTDAAGRVWLHYTTPQPDRTAPAADILAGRFDRAFIDGNIVLIGLTFAGSNDLVATPLTPAMPGVEVHAELIEQALLGWFLARPDWALGAETLFTVVVALGLVILLQRGGAIPGAALAFAALAAASAGSWYAFSAHRMLVDPVYPAIVIAAVYSIATLLGYRRTQTAHRAVRGAFARYMSPALVDELARHPEKLVLGGETRTMTLMFCDIRGFTTISEGLDARQLTQFINEFLSPMTEIILDHRGTIDKYIGDCIMAFWNAPLHDADHAEHAVRAAQAMRHRLVELNVEWRRRAEAEGRIFTTVEMGIGINTGECSVGNMGSQQRFDYSVLGDAVNIASRLEGLTKLYGVDCIIGESTAALVPDWPFIELDLVLVKGKVRPAQIFTLMPEAAGAAGAAAEWIAKHRRLIAAYRAQDWKTALAVTDDGLGEARRELGILYAVYKRRIEGFVEMPPPASWDGVYVAPEK
ncbi:MAG: adenylate cyclase [Rhodospirillales bacterium]|nr:adenylate cyclase [Rhodospirillales bacterium]